MNQNNSSVLCSVGGMALGKCLDESGVLCDIVTAVPASLGCLINELNGFNVFGAL